MLSGTQKIGAELPRAVIDAAAALPPALHRNEHVSRLVDLMQRRPQAVTSSLT